MSFSHIKEILEWLACHKVMSLANKIQQILSTPSPFIDYSIIISPKYFGAGEGWEWFFTMQSPVKGYHRFVELFEIIVAAPYDNLKHFLVRRINAYCLK